MTNAAIHRSDSIEVFEFSSKVQNTLRRQGLVMVGALTACTATDILDFRNSGMRTLEEIETKLAAHGLALRTSPPCGDALIDDLGLSTRAHNALRREGIVTISELTACDRREPLDLRQFGASVLAEVVAALARHGLEPDWQMPVTEVHITPDGANR
ncbi:DNA-directed RNA polymerase subunit alpha C-terminal domain-containing protein [Spirillospora sp. CA-294931]|uniref:DNA-directed RNA polymerase subunit alpha C-terminal domain-containing protein n=1 Tax=Spirillospora sp. CA-294931 TaxID=3240042 RepID=UPI003D8F4D16